ncbi:Transposable element Tcb1 transposase [Anthophora retusa]
MKQHLHTHCNINVSAETVRRTLRDVGMHGRMKIKIPLLTKRHKKIRLEFARKYENFTEADWSKVIWSDETKIDYFGSDGREWTWKSPGQQLQSHHVHRTIKFGGGHIMIWSCMTSEGVGCVDKIEGTMTAKSYIKILENSLLISLEKWGKTIPDVIFQHDNDPKHKANCTKQWLVTQGFQVLDWPPQSPDLNPIEHLWGLLKRSVANFEPGSRSSLQLWADVVLAWQNIQREQCRNLVDSMPRRIKAVIKAKGGYTKY